MTQSDDQRLRNLFVEHGLISAEVADEVLREAATKGGQSFFELLVDRGHVIEDRALLHLAEMLECSVVDLDDEEPAAEALDCITADVAQTLPVLPLRISKEGRLVVAFGESATAVQTDDVAFMTGREIEPVIASARKIRAAVARVYKETEEALIEILDEELDEQEFWDEPGDDDVPVVVNTVTELLDRATALGESEVHIDRREDDVFVRFRVRRHAVGEERLAKSAFMALVGRLKILAGLDIAERRMPQNGSFEFELDHGRYNCLVTTLPAHHGERLTLRVTRVDRKAPRLAEQEADEGTVSALRDLLSDAEGIVFAQCSDPRRRSEFLCSILREVDPDERIVIAISDYGRLPLDDAVARITVDNHSGLSPALAVRSAARQLPDVIMLGEVRDRETLQCCIDASRRGIVILTSLPVSEPVHVISRCYDMGVDPCTLAESLSGIVFQYPVDRLCPDCRQRKAGEGGFEQIWEPGGCDNCERGFKGETVFYRTLVVDESLRTVIRQAPGLEALSAEVDSNCPTITEAARDRIESGEMARSDLGRLIRV